MAHNDLSGKAALVCGGSQGIGLAAARELAARGAAVTVVARSEPPEPGFRFLWADLEKIETLVPSLEAQLQSLEPNYQAKHADGVHDLLLKLGDLSAEEIAARSMSPEVAATIEDLVRTRRAVRLRIARETRFVAVEYAARYRDALGAPLPPGLADAFLAPAADPLGAIARRFQETPS